jgi:hypothetical protein
MDDLLKSERTMRGSEYVTNRSIRGAGVAILALTAALTAGCASAGATLGSGVSERLVEEAPYYTGRRSDVAGAAIAYLPVVYQRGASQEAIFDPAGEEGSAVVALLREMNEHLGSMHLSAALEPASFRGSSGPDVQFGCHQSAAGECLAGSRELSERGHPWMRLAVTRPSRRWSETLAAELDAAGAEYAVVVTLEVGQYWTHQRNFRGDKEVRLGTGHHARVPWLTSLDQPVQVLQLTGVLVDRHGRAHRAGAEGLMVRPTPLLASAFGVQALVSDGDIERIREARREDLPGRPLVWETSLRTLVAELTGTGATTFR